MNFTGYMRSIVFSDKQLKNCLHNFPKKMVKKFPKSY